MIEHIENMFEGKRTAKKVMTLFAIPRFHLPFRRRMRVTNREFECYHQAERLATQVAIPAITERKRQEIQESGRPATFAERMPGGSTKCLVYFLGAALLTGACMSDVAWLPLLAETRPWAPYVAGFLFFLSLRAFFFRQIGVDRDNIYIMRRDWVSRKIPIHSVADVRVLDNRMRILVTDPKSGAERQAYKTSHFIRNRGVLLQLIREMVEAHHETEATPITEIAGR